MKKSLMLVLLLHLGYFVFAQSFREVKIFVPPITGVGRMADKAFFYRQLSYEVVIQYHALVRALHGSDFILRGSVDLYVGITEPEEDPDTEDKTLTRKPTMNTRGMLEFFAADLDNDLFFETEGGIDYYRVPQTILDDINSEEPPLIEPGHFEFEPFFEFIYDNDPALEFIFYLELVDSVTGQVIAQQGIIYQTIDASVSTLLSILLYNMFSGIPDIEERPDIRNSLLFLGASFLWTPRLYTFERQSFNVTNIGAGLSAELHFSKRWSVELGAQITQDWVVIYETPEGPDSVRDLVCEIPLALKFVLKPLDYFMLEPYLGVHYNFSLWEITKPFIISWLAGFQVGIKAGPGVITIDPRYSMDMNPSIIKDREQEYQRYMLQIGVGYKFGFFPKQTNKL